jgi:DNA-damage-inducible protein D
MSENAVRFAEEEDSALDVFHFDDDRANFEQLAEDNGFHFWKCSQLMRLLGYESAAEAGKTKPVQRAIAACNTLGIPIQENFDFQPDGDVKLTRFACYLVAMNADPKKPGVAAAQAYFAALAVQFSQYARENEAMDRVLTREEITQQERSLSSAAKQAGVENYAFFQNAGYRGMYNMNLNQLRERKGVPSRRSPLDFMGATESAANLLRIRLTEDKIGMEHAQGQNALENTAVSVGKEVRDLLKRTIGKTPESLPPAPDIRQVHRGLKDTSKGFKAIDAPKKKLN